MPHVIYLHSALTQNRIVPQNDDEARRLYRFTRVDVVIAMAIAGLINLSMLVMAASVFYKSGLLQRGLARDRAQDARADPRRRLEHALRPRAPGLRAVELDRSAPSRARS